jgi:hypothetical protein
MEWKNKFTQTHYRSLERGQNDDAVKSIRQFADPIMEAANTHRSLPEATAESLAAGAKIEPTGELNRDLHEILGGVEMALRKRLYGDEKFTSEEIGLVSDLERAAIHLRTEPGEDIRADLLKAFEAGRQGVSTGGRATMTSLMQNHNDSLSDGSRHDRIRVKVDHSLNV